MGAEGRYTALGLLKGCKTDAGTGVVMWAAGEGMGLSAAGGIFLAEREYCVDVSWCRVKCLLKKKESWPFLFFLMSSTAPSAAIPPGSGPSGPGVWAARLRGQRGATLSRVDTQAAPMLLSDSRLVRQVLNRGEGPDALWLGLLCFHICEFKCFSTMEFSAKRNRSHLLSNT